MEVVEVKDRTTFAAKSEAPSGKRRCVKFRTFGDGGAGSQPPRRLQCAGHHHTKIDMAMALHSPLPADADPIVLEVT